MKIKVEGATATQLLAFARIEKGIEGLVVQHGRAKILQSLMDAGFNGDEIEVYEEDPGASFEQQRRPHQSVMDPLKVLAMHGPESETAKEALVRQQKRDACSVEVVINASHEEGGDQPIPLAYNGTAMAVSRGIPQRIRLPYLEVLRNAISVINNPDPKGGLMPPRPVETYPFNIVPGSFRDPEGAVKHIQELHERVSQAA